MAIESFWVLQNHHHHEGLHPFECPARLVIILLSPKREERELERELCRNTETTKHGERIDPNRI